MSFADRILPTHPLQSLAYLICPALACTKTILIATIMNPQIEHTSLPGKFTTLCDPPNTMSTENRMVSVIIPMRNEEQYIVRCVQSLLNKPIPQICTN